MWLVAMQEGQTKFGHSDPLKQTAEEFSRAGEDCRPAVLAKWFPKEK